MSIQPYDKRLPNGVLFEIMIIMLLPLSVTTSFRSLSFYLLIICLLYLSYLRHADCTVYLYTYRGVNIFHIEIIIELLKH